ncbi:MAG: hypothetical protein GX285_08160 [Clostridiales bacterium]|nr:hypothetical protein [Clostridiales bacterium]
MKNRYIFILIALSMVLILTGCSKNAGSREKEKEKEIFYGEWITADAISYAPVSAITEEEYNEKYLGKVVLYSKDKAEFENDMIENPVYQKIIVDNAKFYNEYRVRFEDLGIESGQATIVEIKDWINPCSLLIIKDEKTMISLWDGLFFELKRK